MVNALPHARLVREVLALARAAFGWTAELRWRARDTGRTDARGRFLFDVQLVVEAGSDIGPRTNWKNSVPLPLARKYRPPAERALRSMRRLLWACLDHAVDAAVVDAEDLDQVDSLSGPEQWAVERTRRARGKL